MASRKATPPAPATLRNGNYILAGLSAAEYQRLRPDLVTVKLEQKQVLWEPNRAIENIYFPLDAVASILAVTEEGLVEVGTIGNEGVVGLPVFLGGESSPGKAVIQVAGEAERIGTPVFLREVRQDGRLRQLLHRYTQGFMTQVSQSTACNRAHTAEQRLARWLLILRDRVGKNEFPITHEFLGQMLGVRRATVTETAAELQRAGLISYRRGLIKIRDGDGLEEAACECYRIVRDEFKRLLGVPVG